MEEIMNNGPVVVELVIYGDFYNYGGGTYTHVAGDAEGTHAMVLLGWEIDGNGNFVWIC